MTESEWLAGTDPRRMLRWLTGTAVYEDTRGLTSAAEAAWEMVRVPRPGLISTAMQAALLREIFGNPFLFRPPHGGWTNPNNVEGEMRFIHDEPWRTWLHWNDSTVLRIARRVYDERRWQDMPILADALFDAGCDDEDILRHCRGQERCSCQFSGKPGYVHRHGKHGPGYYPCRACHTDDDPEVGGTGWRPLSGPHVRDCWVIALILGRR